MGDDVIKRAVLRQPFDGGFGADFPHAGDVINTVAYQYQIIHNQAGWQAELVDDSGFVQNLVGHGVDQSHMCVD